MDKETIEQIEEFIFKAVQSGKQETSGLVDEVFRRIDPAIERSIEKNVNGKIRLLDQKITTYIENDDKWKEEHLKANEKLIDIVNLNTEYRLQTVGGLIMIKFILGFVGFGTLISLVLSFIK
jgi:hypothetical protein